jgi:hypothetical protein
MRPNLKQFRDLQADDFTKYPVWVSCHSVDYEEPWYGDTDEETFRPWTGSLPVGTEEMYLVGSTFTLRDGTCLSGFTTPADDDDAWGTIQPQIFSRDGHRISVWFGMFPPANAASEVSARLGKRLEEIFPIHYSVPNGVVRVASSGTIPGLMKVSGRSFEIIK